MGTEPEQDPDNYSKVRQFYEPLTSPSTEVTNLIFPSNEVVWYLGNNKKITWPQGRILTWQLQPT